MTTIKTVLITGASTGIGYYCAHELHRAGFKVIASCRRPEDVERLSGEGLTCIPLDLSDSASINNAVKDVLKLTNGELYALFNNGAYGLPGAVEDLSRNALRQQFETNFFGWVELTNRLLPIMIKQGYGRIIQNSSILGFAALPMRGAYNASKFAIEGISDTLRLELVNTGVHVSLIEPGPIRSQFRHNALNALKNQIDINSSRHQAAYQKAISRLSAEDSTTPFTLNPDAVYKRLLHALNSPKPQVRYYVTTPTYIAGFMKRILPHRWFDKFLLKMGA